MFRRKATLSIMLALSMALCVSLMAIGASLLPEVRAKNGMVTCAVTEASEAGVEMFKKGGNAVDAAVATSFALGVTEPNASGLGGEGFMVIYMAELKKAVAIDFRSAAPALAAEKYNGKTFAGVSGWDLVATPGLVLGMAEAQKRYGKLTLKDALEPAIRIAENGYVITKQLADNIASGLTRIKASKELSSIYLDPMGLPLEEGALLKNPHLAKAMRIIANQGPEAFYSGIIADAIDRQSRREGGLLRKSDLMAYKIYETAPMYSSYRGQNFYGAPPPVGGIIMTEALNIMENFDLSSRPFMDSYNVHIITEALKRGFADHVKYGVDPRFVNIPLAGLQSKAYAKMRASSINPVKITEFKDITFGDPSTFAQLPLGLVDESYQTPTTTQISVMDGKRNAVALTQTLSAYWGAGIAIEGLGIILNNENGNWAAAPSLNAIAPNKRMMTTLVPTILLDKEGMPVMALGTPGSWRIAPMITQIIHSVIDQGLTLQEAIEAPRFSVQYNNGVFEYEEAIPKATLDGLRAMGYSIDTTNVRAPFGGVMGVWYDPVTKELVGATDPRRVGLPVGL